MQKYYKAYEDRYKKYHTEEKKAWAGTSPSIILKDIFEKYNVKKDTKILEVGCGEGQNAIYLLKQGYNVLASDVSPSAIEWCKQKAKKHGINPDNFFVLDVLDNDMTEKFDVIYTISTLHMLVLDEDRLNFLKFIENHLTPNGVGVITIMGNGKLERSSNIDTAFDVVERENAGKTVNVASTSCRIVTKEQFLHELKSANLKVEDYYTTTKISGFNISMVAEVKRSK